MELILLLVLVVFGVVGYGLLKRHLWDQALVRRREMAHRERMMAMEKGIPLDEIMVNEELPTLDHSPRNSQETAVRWVRIVSLCAGLFLLLSGIGMCLAFYAAQLSDLNETWPVGLIPSLAGLGLLLFFLLSRGFEFKSAAK